VRDRPELAQDVSLMNERDRDLGVLGPKTALLIASARCRVTRASSSLLSCDCQRSGFLPAA
jgi:hypothetical protein